MCVCDLLEASFRLDVCSSLSEIWSERNTVTVAGWLARWWLRLMSSMADLSGTEVPPGGTCTSVQNRYVPYVILPPPRDTRDWPITVYIEINLGGVAGRGASAADGSKLPTRWVTRKSRTDSEIGNDTRPNVKILTPQSVTKTAPLFLPSFPFLPLTLLLNTRAGHRNHGRC